jgi:hypothetical protein
MGDIIAKLLGIFVLSSIVERFLEVFSAIYEWSKIRPRVKRFLGVVSAIYEWIKKIFRYETAKERQRTEEKNKQKEKIAFCAVFGVIIGILPSWRLNIGILHELELVTDAKYLWQDYVLTGLAIGGGTEPIHSLVAFLGYKKEEEKKSELYLKK